MTEYTAPDGAQNIVPRSDDYKYGAPNGAQKMTVNSINEIRFGLIALDKFIGSLTWAAARPARFCPGCQITSLQP